jgi:drug/metabolite transporter (DMT)-like permease
MNNEIKGHFYLFLVSLIYASNYSMAKLAMPAYIQPSGFIVLRVCFAALLFWLLSRWQGLPRIAKADLPLVLACALFGVAINMLLFFQGLNLTTPISAALIMLPTPILVMIAAVFLLKEPLSAKRGLGITLGVLGAGLLILDRQAPLQQAPNPILGNILVGINAASYAVYLVLVKPLTAKYPPMTVMKSVFAWGSLMVLPFGLSQAVAVDWANLPLLIWAVITFTLFFVTFLTYLLNAAALQWLSPAVVSGYIYLQPLLTAIIALAIGSDELSLGMVMAAFLIGYGVYLMR